MRLVSQYCLKSLCAAVMLLLTTQAYAACKMDDPPVIPQSPDISFEELKAIKASVDSYMESANYYIGCQRREKKIQAAIDEMKLVAADYNVLIMLYKSTLTEEEEMQLSGR